MSKPLSSQSINVYKRLFSRIKPWWPMLLLGLFANILSSGIDAAFTYMMRPFLDKGFIDIDMTFVQTIPLIALIGITCRGLISAAAGYCMTWVARSVVKSLRQQVFAHALHLPASYFDKNSSSQVVSRLLYDVEQVAQVSADALTDFVQNVCLVIGLLTVMFLICWQLSLLFMLTIPFVGLIVNYTSKRMRKISHRVQQSMGDVTEIAGEAIEGYKVVRIFGAENYVTEKFDKATEAARHNDMKVAVAKALNVAGVQFVIALGIAGIVFSSIQLASVITITAGSFVAIVAAMFQLIRPMKILTTLNAIIQKGLAGAESVFNLLDEPIEVRKGASCPKTIKGEIIFDQVSFGYRPEEPVLQGISFRVPAGQSVALVGQSGSGKTTLTSLLARFYEMDSGSITLDGIAINTLNPLELRAHIALVSQQVILFNDTLANNIAYGSVHADREAIIAAAKSAFAHEFIEKLPQGYDTQVGENGVLLSGGQRQRIAIARAILKNAPVLILDEATSALDSESEHYIQAALEQVMKNRTTFIIAHRLSTIVNADNIIVFRHGRVVEQGNHASLLRLNGYYAQLYGLQYATQDVEEVV